MLDIIRMQQRSSVPHSDQASWGLPRGCNLPAMGAAGEWPGATKAKQASALSLQAGGCRQHWLPSGIFSEEDKKLGAMFLQA